MLGPDDGIVLRNLWKINKDIISSAEKWKINEDIISWEKSETLTETLLPRRAKSEIKSTLFEQTSNFKSTKIVIRAQHMVCQNISVILID